MAERWLTFAELAEMFGVSPAAARQRVIRRNWPRRPGNDRKVQVLVPDDVNLDTNTRIDRQTFEALEAQIAALKVMVAKANSVADERRADNDSVLRKGYSLWRRGRG